MPRTGRPKTYERCTIDGCEKSHWALGFCRAHYNRNLRHGDPLAYGSKKRKHRPPVAFLESAFAYSSDECLPWPHGVNRFGYGLINVDGRSTLVSRLICKRSHGEPPAEKTDAAHSCGNPNCVNPRHIRWATRAENMADKERHGTTPRGSQNGHAKLLEADVRSIRAQPNRSYIELAREFGVAKGTIVNIRLRNTWAWLDAARDSK